MRGPHASSLPIFWGHGTADPLITFEIGRLSVDLLKSSLGLSAAPRDAPDAASSKGIAFREYPGLQHGASPEELVDLKAWLKKILP
jgi:predicted esterase